MTSHRAPETAASGRKYAALILAVFLAVLLCGAVLGGFGARYLGAPKTVTRTRVVVRHRVLEVPEALTGCEQQLETALSGIFPWMKAHRYALPVAVNGWKPDTSDCDKAGK